MKKQLYRLAAVPASIASFLTTSSVALAQNNTGISIDESGLRDSGFALSFGGLLNGLLSFVMVLAALLVFFYLIWGGIEWITSGGDKGQTEKARNKITAAVIGLIILASAYAILTLALTFLGFEGGLQDVLNNGIRPINQ